MKVRISEENTEAEQLLPPRQPDGSRIGVNYADAYIKPMNVELDDGRRVQCSRKGLKITLIIGERQGEAIMRRIEDGPDARQILLRALERAAEEAASQFSVQDGVIWLEV